MSEREVLSAAVEKAKRKRRLVKYLEEVRRENRKAEMGEQQEREENKEG